MARCLGLTTPALIFLWLVVTLEIVDGWPSPWALVGQTARVLNFFPIPVSEECTAQDGRRTGICLNTYDCRIQSGESSGPCALGFGVCCVFAQSCDSVVENPVSYFVNPGFPSLMNGKKACKLKIKKMAPDITQFRLDFIHFNVGQPNRRTGACDTDVFKVTGGSSRDIRLCGQNSGQHMYFDVENIKEPVTITMNLTQDIFRLWEIKVTQIEFNNRAPAGCNQYFQGNKGVIQTMNYAINGRHLANQDYTICIRQEERMCSIVYEPCDDNSFKIGPPIISNDDNGSGGGPVFGAQGTPTGQGSSSSMQQCSDRVVMPCDTEDFITPAGPGFCDLLHCGNSLCSSSDGPCRIESSIKPFNIRVQFGPGRGEENPEDNIGMCLRYEQQACT